MHCLLLGTSKALGIRAFALHRILPQEEESFPANGWALTEMNVEIRLGASLYNVLNQCRFLESSDASFINHLRCFSGRTESGSPTCKREKEERHALTSHHIECKYYEIPPKLQRTKSQQRFETDATLLLPLGASTP